MSSDFNIQSFSFDFTEEECNLIREETPFPENLQGKFRMRVIENGKPVVKLNPLECRQLMGCLAIGMQSAVNSQTYFQLQSLTGTILYALLNAFSESNNPLDLIAASRMAELFDNEEKDDEQFLNELLGAGLIDEVDRDDLFGDDDEPWEKEPETEFAYYRNLLMESPPDLPEFESLSAVQAAERIANLMVGLLGSPDCPVTIHDQASLKELSDSSFFVNCYAIMKYLAGNGKLRIIKDGSLNKSDLTKLLEALPRKEEIEDYYRGKKNLSIPEFHYVFVALLTMLDQAELIDIERKQIKLSSLGRKYLSENQSGQLYIYLLECFHQTIDQICVEFLPLSEGVICLITPFLARLSLQPKDQWFSFLKEMPNIGLYSIQPSFEDFPGWDLMPRLLFSYVIRPLRNIGLIEVRRAPQYERFSLDYEFRKTPLFDRVIKYQPELGILQEEEG